jgi:hypothetical protein
MPFAEVVITDESERNWYIDGGGQQTVGAYQQQEITVTGHLWTNELILADGRKLGIRRTLRDVSIIR